MLKSKPNSQYNIAEPKSLSIRIATYQRRRMYKRFIADCKVLEQNTILDVGVTSDQTYESSNYLEAWHLHKSMITAAGVDDASFLKKLYPGMKFVRANGLELPFESQSFDIVHSSAVLEHVGSLDNQIRFVKECTRVARKAVFITTPNRWFPFEFHTILPLIYWLPKLWFRSLMRVIRLNFFAEESNLNLMSRSDLLKIVEVLSDFKFEVSSVSLAAWPSNLLLIGNK